MDQQLYIQRERLSDIERKIAELGGSEQSPKARAFMSRSVQTKRQRENFEEERRALKLTIAQLEDEREHRYRQAEMKYFEFSQKGEADEAAFWFRRFFTALAIANAGAIILLVNLLWQSKLDRAIAAIVDFPIELFSLGMCSAGLVPILLWARTRTALWVQIVRNIRTRNPSLIDPWHLGNAKLRKEIRLGLNFIAYGLALFSAAFFVAAMMQLAGVVSGIAGR